MKIVIAAYKADFGRINQEKHYKWETPGCDQRSSNIETPLAQRYVDFHAAFDEFCKPQCGRCGFDARRASKAAHCRIEESMGGGEPPALDKTHTRAFRIHILRNQSDGMTMFDGCTLLRDEVALVNQALIDYVKARLAAWSQEVC